MDLRKELNRKVEKKRSEIEQFHDEIRELNIKMREALAYVIGLEETLKLLPRETPTEAASTVLRPDSAVAKARETILKAGKPLHINEILKELGKEINHDSKASLSGSIGAYVRNGQVFTRPAPNTFGLLEVEAKSEDELPPDFGIINGKAKETTA
ncbi:MAG TPA: hypothetical protein VND20_07795 [Candidatus Binataceae bacterium]|nr:hypothetical protein [Candidatus Binataceae bacterium]